MNQQEQDAGEEIGWHIIGRGGDMTARVHGGMSLGQAASGEFSFETADALVELSLEGEQLKLTAVNAEQELKVPGERPARAVLVNPQTHVTLTFRDQTLDIDNDFTVGGRPLNSLPIEVVDTAGGAFRRALGPLAAGRRGRGNELVQPAGGRVVVADFRARAVAAAGVEVAGLQRLLAAVPATARPPLLLGVSLLAVVLVLLILAVSLTGPRTAPGVPVGEPARPAVGLETPEAAAPEPTESEPLPAGAPDAAELRVSDAVLERFTALIEADELPDKGTLDFMVETLRSLQSAYPNDTRVSEALGQLAVSLLEAARQRYDAGEPLQAGRLIELAGSTGMAGEAVEATLEELSTRPLQQAQRDAPVAPTDDAEAADDADEPEPAAVDRERVQPDVFDNEALATEDGLDAPVAATAAADASQEAGDPPVAEDAVAATAPSPSPSPAPEDNLPSPAIPVDAASPGGPNPPASPADAVEPAPSTPYRSFSELTVVRRAALRYPSAAPRGRRGSVDVSFTVTATGQVSDLKAESDLEAVFVEVAKETIAGWRFAPVLIDGLPAAVRSAIRVTFRD